jgi:hypothetical protein
MAALRSGARSGPPAVRRESPRAKHAGWAAVIGLFALSGCSWASGWFGSSEPAARPILEPGTCPTAAILKPLSQTALFAPGQPHEPPGVSFYGLLSEVEAKCDRAGDAVRLALDVVVVGERGPAAGGASGLDLWYFVAVTGSDQAILGKRLFPVHIEVPTTAKRAAVSDHIEETIPLGGRRPGDVNIILGFQQGAEAVEFYRHYRGR